ncbi:hypothetical protein [Dyella koreensis]|uniref:Uncharacterized protein n=1 Tax=Dyella koreensis TaxID=311235 RepID=A0ABW8K4W2_9GAMM
MQIDTRGNSMHTPHQTNSLHFHPHKPHFAPLPDAADSEQRNRWFPGYDASVASRRAKAPTPQRAIIPGIDSPEPGKDWQDMDANGIHDDGAPYSSADLHDR